MTVRHSRVHRRPMILSVLFAVGLSACAGQQAHGGHGGSHTRSGASPAPVSVPSTKAAETTVRPVLSIAGIIAPLQNVALSSALSEPADSVPVQEGQRVQSGQTLAVLDTNDLTANLEADERTVASDHAKVDQARYQGSLAIGQGGDQVTSAQAALAQARQTLTQDQANLVRNRQLVAQGYISQQALDQQATLVSNDQSAVRSAQASLASALTNERVNGTGSGSQGLQAANVAVAVADEQSAQAQADQLRAQIAKAVIVSPVAGVIVNRNLNPGEYPGSRTIFTIQEDDSVYAMLNASSADVFHIPNQSAVEVLPSGSSTPLHGRVVAVLGQVAPGSTNFTVKVLISNVNGSLPAGVPVTGTISLAATHGIGIPTSAFLDDSRTSVMAVVNGTAHVLKVHSLVDDGRTAIVTGVDAGTSVVTNGQLDLTEGQAIGNAAGHAHPGGGGSATKAP